MNCLLQTFYLLTTSILFGFSNRGPLPLSRVLTAFDNIQPDFNFVVFHTFGQCGVFHDCAHVTVHSLPIAVGSCAILGAAVGTLDVAGGALTGDGREFEGIDAREERRRRFFKPRKEELEAVTASE